MQHKCYTCKKIMERITKTKCWCPQCKVFVEVVELK